LNTADPTRAAKAGPAIESPAGWTILSASCALRPVSERRTVDGMSTKGTDETKPETAPTDGEISAEELEEAAGGVLIAGATPPPMQPGIAIAGIAPEALPPGLPNKRTLL
jgi:hypothetical protein